MNEEVLKEIAKKHKDLILPPYDEMMEMDGFEAICAFSKTFGGASIYVPKLRTIFKQCINKEMLEQYVGANIRELVQKYGFSERYVRNLIMGDKMV